MEVEMIQEQEVTRRMFVLFDPGSTNSYITESELPKNLTPNFHNQAQEATTLGGERSHYPSSQDPCKWISMAFGYTAALTCVTMQSFLDKIG